MVNKLSRLLLHWAAFGSRKGILSGRSALEIDSGSLQCDIRSMLIRFHTRRVVALVVSRKVFPQLLCYARDPCKHTYRFQTP